MKYLKYLNYVIRHKWFVLLACFRRGLYWQGIIHDWSKFLPDEFFPYAEYFYGFKPSPELAEYARREGLPLPDREQVRMDFDHAWLRHIHRNPHHWQHWILREDGGSIKILKMPRRYRIEMECDWEGAGRAITGKTEFIQWYLNNFEKMQLHPCTRRDVHHSFNLPPPSFITP